jgi:hypothetical protein
MAGGCGGGGGGNANAVLTNFTTVGNVTGTKPVNVADFAQFFGKNPPSQQGVTVSTSVLAADASSGGSWTVSVNGVVVSTIKCTIPTLSAAAVPSAPPAPLISSNPQPIVLPRVVQQAPGPCAPPPTPTPSIMPNVNLISLSANAIIATDFNIVQSSGPATINGQDVVNFKTIITTQLVGGKAQYKILTTSFAKNIGPKQIQCVLFNPGTDPAVLDVIGAVLAVQSAKASDVTPKVMLEGKLPQGNFLMYGKLETFDINRIPKELGGQDDPTQVTAMEVGNVVVK